MSLMIVIPCAILAILFYLVAGGWQVSMLMQATRPHPAVIRLLGILGVILHAVVMYQWINGQNGTLNLGILEALSLASWLMTLLIIIVSLFVPLIAASSISLPLSAISLIALLLLPASVNYNQFSAGLLAHIAGSILAFSLFAIAAAQACLIAFQYRALKSRRLRGIVQVLPPLTQMERLLSALITLGVIFLTLSIVSGAIFDHGFPEHYLTPKAILSVLAWLIFSSLLWLRYSSGWRGRRAVRWTFIGALVIFLIFLSSQLVFIR